MVKNSISFPGAKPFGKVIALFAKKAVLITMGKLIVYKYSEKYFLTNRLFSKKSTKSIDFFELFGVIFYWRILY